jgi:hypothetical protein
VNSYNNPYEPEPKGFARPPVSGGMTGDAFADRLAALRREERAAFVAAVYDARGWAVTREGGEVAVTPPGSDRTHRLAVTAAGTTVATRDDGDPLDAAELRELLTYALDQRARARLCRRFFDCDPDGLSSDDGDGDGDGGATVAPVDRLRDDASDEAGAPDDGEGASDHTDDAATTATATAGETDGPPKTDGIEGGDDDATEETRGGPWPRRALLVGAAVALVVGSIAAAAGPAFAPAGDAGNGGVGGANTTAVGDNGTAAAGIGSNGTMRASFPPGIDAGGVASVLSVAGAHAEVLSGRSYRIHILHREYVDGRLRGVAEERIAVESSDRYRSRVRVVGTVEHPSPLVAEESVYANGTTLYVRPVEGRDTPESARFVRVTTRETTTPNRIVDRSRRYVRWYLGVEESRIVGHATRDGRSEVQVGLEGDSWPGSRNVTGEARVDERGLVRTIRRESRPVGEPSVRIVVTIRVTTEPVRVTRPAWVDPGPETDTAGSTPVPRPTPTARTNATESASRRVWP